MIPEVDLRISAEKSLTALQIWALGTQGLEDAIKRQHELSPEIASLVGACQKLRKNGYRKGRTRLAENNIMKRHVQSMMEDLADDTLEIFALLTWHFNADFRVPLPRQLLLFFAEPYKNFGYVCNDIHSRYSTIVKSESVKGFKRRFIRLLGLVEHQVVEGIWVLYI
ncbi:hypothetical protein N7489_011640 [Penicillium chrysogenum]|uniref:uncharacterized protein n=1 Tax=Penicillium chrysogenum TaxID=5076 RepID=UPI0024DF113C|nr:uncharacterized protein N7489_011640 [Penicillium chrysogenum]KAJ5230932.1 hypothetical protein N7489_011640 [Penicillium chrysogenum]